MKFHRYLCLLLLACFPQLSFACKPVHGFHRHIPTAGERDAAADLVFSGKVVALKRGEEVAALANDPHYTRMFTMEVAKWVKGTGGNSIEVFDTTGSDCDHGPHIRGVGEQWTVHVQRRDGRNYVASLDTFCTEGTPAQDFPLGFCAVTLKQPSRRGGLSMAAGTKTTTGPAPGWELIRADLAKGSSFEGYALPPGTVAYRMGSAARPTGPAEFRLPEPISLGPVTLSGCVDLNKDQYFGAGPIRPALLEIPAPFRCAIGRVTVYGAEVNQVTFALPDLHPVHLLLAHDALFQGYYMSGGVDVWFWPDTGNLKEFVSARNQPIGKARTNVEKGCAVLLNQQGEVTSKCPWRSRPSGDSLK